MDPTSGPWIAADSGDVIDVTGEAKFPDGTLKPLADYVHSQARQRDGDSKNAETMTQGEFCFNNILPPQKSH